MAETGLDVRRTSDHDLVQSLVPDHPHLTKPLADREDKQYIVAELDGEPVGTCWVRPLTERSGVFGGLWVDPDARGLGIGGRVMDAGLAELALRGARVGMLGVHLDNEEGLALARTRGFRTVSFVPGRSTAVGGAVAGLVERVSPLPFPDRSTRLMVVWLGGDRIEHRPEPERPDAAGVDGHAITNGDKPISPEAQTSEGAEA
jgi:ribosomal protein S18 acetylase RimI-like enzyme